MENAGTLEASSVHLAGAVWTLLVHRILSFRGEMDGRTSGMEGYRVDQPCIQDFVLPRPVPSAKICGLDRAAQKQWRVLSFATCSV